MSRRHREWGAYGVGVIQPGTRSTRSTRSASCVEFGAPIRGDRTWLADRETVIAPHEWPALVEHLSPRNGLTRPNLHEILSSRALASGADAHEDLVHRARLFRRPRGRRLHRRRAAPARPRGWGGRVVLQGPRAPVRLGVEAALPRPGVLALQLPRHRGLEEIWMWFSPNGSAAFVPLGHDLMYILTIETPIEDWRAGRGRCAVPAAPGATRRTGRGRARADRRGRRGGIVLAGNWPRAFGSPTRSRRSRLLHQPEPARLLRLPRDAAPARRRAPVGDVRQRLPARVWGRRGPDFNAPVGPGDLVSTSARASAVGALPTTVGNRKDDQ